MDVDNVNEINGLITKIQPVYIFQSFSKNLNQNAQSSDFSFKREGIVLDKEKDKENVDSNCKDVKVDFLESTAKKMIIANESGNVNVNDNGNWINIESGILFSGHFGPVESKTNENVLTKPFKSTIHEEDKENVNVNMKQKDNSFIKKTNAQKNFAGFCKTISLCKLNNTHKSLKTSNEPEKSIKEKKDINLNKKKNQLGNEKSKSRLNINNNNNNNNKTTKDESSNRQLKPNCSFKKINNDKSFISKKHNESKFSINNNNNINNTTINTKKDYSIDDLTDAFSKSVCINKNKKESTIKPKVSLYYRKKTNDNLNVSNSTSMMNLNISKDISSAKTPIKTKSVLNINSKEKTSNKIMQKNVSKVNLIQRKNTIVNKKTLLTPVKKTQCESKTPISKENIKSLKK